MNFLDNELKLYFGDDYVVNQNITLHHPKIGDIVDIGESEYFGTVYTIAAIPSDMKSQLWDIGICWEDISDFDFFYLLTRTLTPDRTYMFFGDLDFTKFELVRDPVNEEILMYQIIGDKEIILDLYAYLRIAEAIRKMHGIVPKIEHASSKTVQRILIDEDRKRIAKIKDENHGSQLVPMISSLINCSDFKYGLEEVRKMPIYAFMDSVVRVQMIKSATALLQGCYSGMLDTSKIDKKQLNWMRDYRQEANNASSFLLREN